jgi:hypothetical protein
MNLASLLMSYREIWLASKRSRMSRKRSGSIRRFRHRSARMLTTIFSTDCSAFVTAQSRTLLVHQSCRSSTRSQVDARKWAPIIQPPSFMRKPSGAMFGQTLMLTSLFLGSRTWLRFIA